MSRSGGVSLAGVAAVLFDLDGVLVDTESWWHAEPSAWAAREAAR